MSIVPLRPNWDVVLRHNDAVVVFDRNLRQLVLHSASRGTDVEVNSNCPFCHRPLASSPSSGHRRNSSATVQPGFVNPQYFRMLNSSLPPSAAPSAPTSGSASPTRTVLSQDYDSDAEFQPASSPSPGISATAFSPNYFKRFFIEEKELGRGGKAVVLLVKHVLDGVELGHFACKRVPVGDDHQWLEKVLIEVQLLQNLQHPNLVSYRHVWLENARLNTFGPKVPCAFILQQYCNAGDLQKYVYGSPSALPTAQALKARLRRRSRGESDPPLQVPRKLSFEEIYSFFRDITHGIRFLHVNGYIHRDLKPSNCLIHDSGSELRVLVSDFGEMQYKTDVRNSTGTTGTISYCAPEVLRRTAPDGPYGNFTFKSDIFSLGMILHFLCFDALPYKHANVVEEEKEDVDLLRDEITSWEGFIRSRRIRPDLPEQLYKILTMLLSADPEKRPTADEVLDMIQAPSKYGGKEKMKLHRQNGSAGTHSSRDPRVVSLGSDESEPAHSTLTPSKSAGALVARKHHASSSENDKAAAGTTADEVEQQLLPFGMQKGIVLRSSVEPPPSFEHTHRTSATEIPPLLLPPAKRARPARKQLISQSINVFLLVFKILSLTQPCLPQAASPWVLYPALLLAAVDFGVKISWLHVMSLAVHITIIAVASRWDGLCLKA
ncbi:putative serine/threonine-protein kinase iks1 [Ascosphaera aggregata]|nr:putative serine/threonine-protein kinase iks1 [Ascosphaera aggregata]